MTAAEMLTAARELIADKSRWTFGAWARDEWGATVDSRSPEAVAWCASAALGKVAPVRDSLQMPNDDPHYVAYRALNKAAQQQGQSGIIGLNDEVADHERVLKAYDDALVIVS